ncbi:MAG: cytochrome c3 family protein [Deltaproteobacteria bacterium]|nr:cytochrome c3 family protein [Deltaproteobacteria bacterium]
MRISSSSGSRLRGIVAAVLFLLVFLTPGLVRAQAVRKDLCLSCHGTEGLEKVREGKPVSLFVSGEKFARSVHGSLECTGCHSDVSQIPHAPELKAVQCSTCHAAVSREYSRSVHGRANAKGDRDAATCSDCHGSHDVLPRAHLESRVNPLNLPRTCGGCHGLAGCGELLELPRISRHPSSLRSAVYRAQDQHPRDLRSLPCRSSAGVRRQRSREGSQGRESDSSRLHRLPHRS